jgi:hypothetical protein
MGTAIGAANVGATATGTRGPTIAIHMVALAGGGHLKAASGCVAAATARTTATAPIEVVGTTGAADTAMGMDHMADMAVGRGRMVVGGTSAKR